MTIRYLALGLVAAAMLALMGCGGGGDGLPNTGNEKGGAVFTVTWPGRTVSRTMESIAIEVKRGETQVARQVANRPAQGTSSTVSFASLPVGDLTYRATAYPQSNGGGTAVGISTGPLTIQLAQLAQVTLALSSTVDRLVITPATPQVAVGGTVQLTATAKNAAGQNLLLDPAELHWSSENTGVAAVTTGGVASGIAVGTTTLRVWEETASTAATVTISVTAAPVAQIDHIEITPGDPQIDAGATAQLTATAKTAGGQVVTVDPARWRWNSSNVNVATVTSAGRVSAVAQGTAAIRATEQQSGKFASVTVTVRGVAVDPKEVEQLLAAGQESLESVTTNPEQATGSARPALQNAVTKFKSALQKDPGNPRGKMGLATAQSMLGLLDLIDLSPAMLDRLALNLLTQSTERSSVAGSALEMPYRLAAAQRMQRTAPSMPELQQRILNETLPALAEALPLYDDVKTAIRNGETIRLRMEVNGQARTVRFGTADLQLLNAFGNLVGALLDFGLAYNLEMPGGTMVRPNPVDANGNGKLDAEEYLIPSPFLTQSPYHTQALSDFLSYLRKAAMKAQEGASLDNHTSGEEALIDVNDPQMNAWLRKVSRYSTGLVMATQMKVTTSELFDDGINRTYNIPGIAAIKSLRGFMPSFPVNAPSAYGVLPDSTFQGIVKPGVPADFIQLSYDSLTSAY